MSAEPGLLKLPPSELVYWAAAGAGVSAEPKHSEAMTTVGAQFLM